METNFENFLSNYFGASYNAENSKKWENVMREIKRYFKDESVGGWSSYYCKKTWNASTLKNDAHLEIFGFLLKIDIQNGADTSKIAKSLCKNNAVKAVEVRKVYCFFI